MNRNGIPPFTIGCISTWPLYQGSTLDRYAHSLIRGISAAAHDRGCHLLMGCGISSPSGGLSQRNVWPVPGPGIDFVPVGPWNTDGLIVIPDDLSTPQSQYLRDLQAAGFPIIFTTPEGPGAIVAVDNASGIQQAFTHLLEHGHRQIAFIAGKSGRGGDSAERLQAYRAALREAGLPEVPRLMAYGEHRFQAGKMAMQQILASGIPFTALIASNDLSCLGAIECLTEAGLRVPDDVAVIGFDDILDARAHSPSLTTIRHPTFVLGYQAVITLLEYVQGQRTGPARVVVPTRLILRQSCGCRPASTALALTRAANEADAETMTTVVASKTMAEASLAEARHSTLEELEAHCCAIVQASVEAVKRRDMRLVIAEITRALQWTEARDEDAHVWQAAISVLYRGAPARVLLSLAPEGDLAFAAGLLDQIRLEISEYAQRQTTRSLLDHMDMMTRLGLMTAQLLATMDVSEIGRVLAAHLSGIGIAQALVALYEGEDEDPVSYSRVLLDAGQAGSHVGQRFKSRQFPTPGLYPAGPPLQLIILPLNVDERVSGFVAFAATNPEPCAVIVHNLSAALRTGRLYHEALEARRLAEDANRLKSRFLSMVSHELRTPLSLIVGLSEIVLREHQDQASLSPVVVRDIEQIHVSGQHLGRLIGDVLDLASSEAGQLRLLLQPLDLSELLRAVALTGEQLTREKGLQWRARLPAMSLWVNGDRTRLRQVMLNLISNAVKFTVQGDVAFDVEASDSAVTIAVSDTGPGILPADQEAIFNEFHRTEHALREGLGGLGLGLAISRQLVQRHQGIIGVHSPGKKEGYSSTFYFTLPLIHEPLPPLEMAWPRFDQPQAIVLLTERLETSAWWESYLRERGFEIFLCDVTQDREWVTRVAASSPIAIVVDDGLVAQRGWEIIGRLKHQAATEDIPILVCTFDEDQQRGELLELNYRLKPLRPEQLSSELARQGLLAHEGAARTILVVDDDPDILAMHIRLVQQAGCRALPARNGREALALLERTRPDLVLLDLIMPEQDGFEVLEAMRSKDATRSTPVIVVTGQVLTEADMERLNRGVAAILQKGLFNTDETLARIEATLARKRSLSQATQRLVRRAIAYIHAHFAEPLSREDIASHVAISADYLTDCFHAELGVTPMVYLTRYRIQQAQSLLVDSDKSITEIALAVGFAEVSHFTRTFQHAVGVSPRAYRRSRR